MSRFDSYDSLNNSLNKLYESIAQTIEERIKNDVKPYTNYSHSIQIDASEIMKYVSIKSDIHANIDRIIKAYESKISVIYQISEITPNSPITCFPSEKQSKYKPFLLIFYFSFG